MLRCVEEVGIGFCLAPKFHPAFRFAAPSRREIGIATVFNLLGPMANPGRVRRQLIGVANPAVAERMLASLRLHGSERAWVVHGEGLDELTTTGTSTVLALDDDSVRTFTVDPVALGFAPAIPDELVGGTPTHNAEVVRRVLKGRARRTSQHRVAQRRCRTGRGRHRRFARGGGDHRHVVDRRGPCSTNPRSLDRRIPSRRKLIWQVDRT